MLRTLSAAAFLALMVPTIGSADDADSEKQVASLSKQSARRRSRATPRPWTPSWPTTGWSSARSAKSSARLRTRGTSRTGHFDFEAMDPSEVKVRVYGDAAVVTSRVHVKLTSSGRVDDRVRVTEVYVKQGGKWRCVSTQVTSIAGKTGDKR